MITQKQIGMLSHQIKVNRRNGNELWELFPDRLEGGANRWQQDLETFLGGLDGFTASEIISSFMNDDLSSAVNQLKHLKNV